MMTQRTGGACLGLTAAALFGVSVPLVKRFLPTVEPILLAGLLYAGAGIALSAAHLGRSRGSQIDREAPIRAEDYPLLLGIVSVGAVLGPLFMLAGLQRLSGTAGSLLLNLEAPLTILLAVSLFGEHVTAQELAGAATIILGGLLLNAASLAQGPDLLGTAALISAAGCWALDNNFTQRLGAVRSPITIAAVKAGSGGAVLLIAASFMQTPWPSVANTVALMALGAVSYGLSVVLDAYALRMIGAAREAAYFAVAPFIGAAASVPLLNERWHAREFATAAVMAVGLWLIQRARHAHVHTHHEMSHEHRHRHDDGHHDHHERVVAGAHSHAHRHDLLIHDHAHVSDGHHRHPHG